jgi:hypothetical protein
MTASSKSQRLQSLSHIGLSFVTIALVLVLLGAWYASSKPVAAIDSIKLENYQKSLHSYATEGLMLAKQYQHQRTLSNYMEVSSRQLYLGASEVDEKLQTETPQVNVEEEVEDTSKRATALADVLAELSQEPDQDELASLMSKLHSLQQELDQ